MGSMNAFNVYRRGRLIDTVFDASNSADDVRESLINHDGYPADIEVRKARLY